MHSADAKALGFRCNKTTLPKTNTLKHVLVGMESENCFNIFLFLYFYLPLRNLEDDNVRCVVLPLQACVHGSQNQLPTAFTVTRLYTGGQRQLIVTGSNFLG